MSQYPVAMAQLRADLGFFNAPLEESQEAYLESLLGEAAEKLADECGIQIDPDSLSDAALQGMYAAWRYRKRVTGEDKPPMLRTAIRARQMRGNKDTEVSA